MIKIYSFISLFIGSVFLISCGDEPQESLAPEANETESPNDSIFEITEFGYELQISLPRELVLYNEVQADLNSSLGLMELSLGKNFQLQISQESADLELFKEDLLNDQLFSYQITQEGDSALLYLAILPDGREFYYNYACLKTISQKPYLIRTDPSGEYTLQSIKRMKTAINSLSAVE